MSIVNLEDYRIARDFLGALPAIRAHIDATENALNAYAHYWPVSRLITAIQDQRLVLAHHERTARKVLTDEKTQNPPLRRT